MRTALAGRAGGCAEPVTGGQRSPASLGGGRGGQARGQGQGEARPEAGAAIRARVSVTYTGPDTHGPDGTQCARPQVCKGEVPGCVSREVGALVSHAACSERSRARAGAGRRERGLERPAGQTVGTVAASQGRHRDVTGTQEPP